MQKLFYDVGHLDKACYEKFHLSEDVLMENAANGLATCIKKRVCKNEKILFVCGPGNNGADGIAAARILCNEYDVSIYLPYGVKSSMAEVQLGRAQALHVNITNELENVEVYIDALFGSGLKKELDTKSVEILNFLNKKNAIKIACDIPSGIAKDGNIVSSCFKADITVTMGALKEALFSDATKDYVGEIILADLGLSRNSYEAETKSYLLERSDLVLPYRFKKNSNKGDYGHLCVLAGEKEGAAILSSTAGFNFGAGLVSIVSQKPFLVPPFLMQTTHIPKNANVVVAGMGLGNMIDDEMLFETLLEHKEALVIDADLFYRKIIIKILEKKDKVILTPHPKEFASLLEITKIAKVSVSEIQEKRFYWAREFTKHFSNCTLVLKGANTIIANKDCIYVNPFGSAKLAKGGSGDVLAGMIGALLAQNYSSIQAALSGSLAHALAAEKCECSSFGLSPIDLCERIKCL